MTEKRVMSKKQRLISCLAALGVSACASDGSQNEPSATCRDVRSRCVGELAVPLDRTGRSEGTVKFGYVFIPAKGGRSSNTIVHLPGGPGFAGTLDEAELTTLFGPVLDDHNLLLFDPRGVGRSTPFACEDLGDPVAWLGEARPTEERIERCVEQLRSIDPIHFGTAAAVDDLEDLRQSLGLGPLKLFGASYGVLAAEVYAARHPSSVHSITFHAGPLSSEPGTMIDRSPRNVELGNIAIDLACSKLPCDLGASAARAWSTVVEAIRREDIDGVNISDALLLHGYATTGAPAAFFLEAVHAYRDQGARGVRRRGARAKEEAVGPKFWVDRSTRRLYMDPNASQGSVEVSFRPTGFFVRAENVTLRGIGIGQYAGDALRIEAGRTLVEATSIVDSGNRGVGGWGSGHKLRNNRISYNHHNGVSLWQANNR